MITPREYDQMLRQVLGYPYRLVIKDRTKEDVMKDWRGTEIEVGDVILYSVRQSCSVDVNEARVTETGPNYVKATWLQSNGGTWAQRWRRVTKVTLHEFTNITVMEKAKYHEEIY